MRVLGLVQVYLDLELQEGASGDAVERERRVALAVLERLAQETRHRVLDAGVTVERVSAVLLAEPRKVEE